MLLSPVYKSIFCAKRAACTYIHRYVKQHCQNKNNLILQQISLNRAKMQKKNKLNTVFAKHMYIHRYIIVFIQIMKVCEWEKTQNRIHKKQIRASVKPKVKRNRLKLSPQSTAKAFSAITIKNTAALFISELCEQSFNSVIAFRTGLHQIFMGNFLKL